MLLKCVKNFVMEDGDVAFTKGRVYDLYERGTGGWYYCDDDEGTDHGMHISHLINHFYYVGDNV